MKVLVRAAQDKCDKAHFVCNDPKFFPRLDQSEDGSAGSMRQIIAFITQVSGEQVRMCREFLGRRAISDPITGGILSAIHLTHLSNNNRRIAKHIGQCVQCEEVCDSDMHNHNFLT